MVREYINGIEELIVHDDFRMVVQNPTQQVGSGAFPREHDKALMFVLFRLMEV